MCFSASASFAAAVGPGAVGVLTLSQVQRPRELPLAAIPLVFAVQQSAEGFLWLELTTHPALSPAPLATIFAAVALALWPSYAPFAAALIEEDRRRKFVQWVLLAISVPVSLFGLYDLSAHPYGACVVGHSLSYSNGHPYPLIIMAAYIVCVCMAFIISSHAALRWFGVIIVAGLIVSSALYFEAFFSVWCFFAAGASLMVYGHFLLMSKYKANSAIT